MIKLAKKITKIFQNISDEFNGKSNEILYG